MPFRVLADPYRVVEMAASKAFNSLARIARRNFLSRVKSLTRTPSASPPFSAPRALAKARFAAVLAVFALVATACGSSSPAAIFDTTKVATAIQQSILKERGVSTTVSCPTNAPLRSGYRFVCSAALDVGTYPVKVVEVNSKGAVSYSNNTPLRVLKTRTVELAIQIAVQHKRKFKSKVTCPATILEAKGVVFTCTATTKKGSGSFTVTEDIANGHVSFVGN